MSKKQVPELYGSFSIRVPDRDHVVEELRRLGRIAFVTPAQGGYVVACDREPELGRKPVENVAALYSVAFNTPVFVAMRDGAGFYFLLVEGKKCPWCYNSLEEEDVEPDDEEEVAALLGDRKLAARHVSEVLASPSAAARVEDILLHPERFASPVKQHAALVKVLRLPRWSIGAGYSAFMERRFPAGLTAEQIIHVG